MLHWLFRSLKQLTALLLMLLLWWVSTAALALLAERLNTQHYSAGARPDPRFYVGVQTEEGGVYAMPLREAQSLPPEQWARQPESGCVEDCLYADTDGMLVYRNEGALQYTKSRYRIENNRIVPVSHSHFTFGHAFMAMAGGFVLTGLLKYAWYFWLYRHQAEQSAAYRRTLWRHWKRRLLWLAAFLLVCAGLGVFQAA